MNGLNILRLLEQGNFPTRTELALIGDQWDAQYSGSCFVNLLKEDEGEWSILSVWEHFVGEWVEILARCVGCCLGIEHFEGKILYGFCVPVYYVLHHSWPPKALLMVPVFVANPNKFLLRALCFVRNNIALNMH